eukprot:1005330_1
MIKVKNTRIRMIQNGIYMKTYNYFMMLMMSVVILKNHWKHYNQMLKNKMDIAFLEAEISTFIGTYHGNVSNNSSVDNDTELSVDEILHDAAIIISDLTTENIKLKQIIHNILKYLM